MGDARRRHGHDPVEFLPGDGGQFRSHPAAHGETHVVRFAPGLQRVDQVEIVDHKVRHVLAKATSKCQFTMSCA